MKKKYPFGGLLNKKRFEWMEKEKNNWLRNLTLSDSINLTECLLSSKLFSSLENNFFPDNPLCLKLGLKLRRKNVRTRI